ncbi:HNH endonuclease signature motif containing protein [Streptomyces aureus]
MIKFSDERLPQRFWDKVHVAESGCWEWKPGVSGGWYGSYYRDGRNVRPHRAAYEALVGPIPEGLLVRHDCDNPPCVNPAHLRTGTDRDNAQDRDSRGRNWRASRTHCSNGHPYDEKNTYWRYGRRYCRACNRAAVRRYTRRNIGVVSQDRGGAA